MIIIRQKTFARHHYEGLNAFQGVMVKLKRNAQAASLKRQKNAVTRDMNREIASANRKATRGAGFLSMFGGKFNDVEKDALARGVLNRNQERVNTAFENRNAQYQSLLDRSTTKGQRIADRGLKRSIRRSGLPQEYGVSTITNTYKNSVNQPQAANAGGGMGFGKKLAIGAAAVGATALAANYLRNRAAERQAAAVHRDEEYEQQPQNSQERY